MHRAETERFEHVIKQNTTRLCIAQAQGRPVDPSLTLIAGSAVAPRD